MVNTIRRGATPNLLVLHYDRLRWEVRNLLLVPRFALSLSCIEKRRPLSRGARRSGWVGCNILLSNIPPDARITLIAAGAPEEPTRVREGYRRLRPLEEEGQAARGWTLDVLRFVRSIGKERFTLADVYGFHDDLRRLHPRNRNINAKIRQQLQRLRALGVIEFLGRGTYLSRLPAGGIGNAR